MLTWTRPSDKSQSKKSKRGEGEWLGASGSGGRVWADNMLSLCKTWNEGGDTKVERCCSGWWGREPSRETETAERVDANVAMDQNKEIIREERAAERPFPLANTLHRQQSNKQGLLKGINNCYHCIEITVASICHCRCNCLQHAVCNLLIRFDL